MSTPHPLAKRSAVILAGVICAFAIYTIAYTTWMIVESYSPALFWDQWEVVRTLMHAHGHVTLKQLWAQHNEHRIPIGRLLSFADLMYFGGRNISLLCEIYLIQAGLLLTLIMQVRRLGHFSRPVFFSVAGLLAYCCFSPLAEENFIWAFQTSFVLSGLAAVLAFAAAVHYQYARTERQRAITLAIAILAAFVAECGLASGVAVSPLLVLLAFALNFSMRDRMILAAASVCEVSAYLIGYRTPGQQSNPLLMLREPQFVLKFIVTELSASWDAHAPNPSLWPSVAESLVFLALLGVIISTVRFVRRSQKPPLHAFLLAVVWFVLINDFVTALGRLNFGMGGAVPSRYETYSLLFWACVGTAVAEWVNRQRARDQLLPAFQIALLILLFGAATRYSTMNELALQQQSRSLAGWAVLEGRNTDVSLIGTKLYAGTDLVLNGYAYLRQHHWIPEPKGPFRLAIRTGAGGLIDGYQRAAASACKGSVDNASIADESAVVTISGWAWDQRDTSIPAAVVITSPDGAVIATAHDSLRRPDVAAMVPQTKYESPGWQGAFVIRRPGIYSVFAILRDDNSACPLGQQLEVDRQP